MKKLKLLPMVRFSLIVLLVAGLVQGLLSGCGGGGGGGGGGFDPDTGGSGQGPGLIWNNGNWDEKNWN